MGIKRENKIALNGLLFDKKSSFLKGCAKGPPLIRDSLFSYGTNTTAENGIDIKLENIFDSGDHKINDLMEIKKIIDDQLRSGYRVLSIGGDHSITYPVLKAYSDHYSGIEILHIDAHPDLYDELEGDRLSHACPFARIMEEKLAVRLVQLGIRTLNSHQKEQADKFNVEIVPMNRFSSELIPEFKNPVYISIDIDGVDPAFAPGVSHHEPGGLTSREVINIIGNLEVPVIGGDVVEYNPDRDVRGITSALAAKLVKEVISKMIENG